MCCNHILSCFGKCANQTHIQHRSGLRRFQRAAKLVIAEMKQFRKAGNQTFSLSALAKTTRWKRRSIGAADSSHFCAVAMSDGNVMNMLLNHNSIEKFDVFAFAEHPIVRHHPMILFGDEMAHEYGFYRNIGIPHDKFHVFLKEVEV